MDIVVVWVLIVLGTPSYYVWFVLFEFSYLVIIDDLFGFLWWCFRLILLRIFFGCCLLFALVLVFGVIGWYVVWSIV